MHYPSSMVQRQTVAGFFENAAEAQQAVQRLLAGGGISNTMQLSTQPDSSVGDNETFPAPAKPDRSSGRFFSSLFGNPEADGSEPVDSGRRCLTVQTQSADEAKRVTALLEQAGAEEVTRLSRSPLAD